jgi:hypothetical protein
MIVGVVHGPAIINCNVKASILKSRTKAHIVQLNFKALRKLSSGSFRYSV